ncbi:MotA/TolQ/ExbB proton channel family protein [Catenovulum sp. SM1970]|uniref:MotA/TolQ/ExbB proton channel family protein n=1 Tax=Marinifaba aquimaris TaxID=2741323 RepID=UPI001571E1B3|nr:MotA/TolQ/ExbB proton channel family protein [Marinifaba aquimaris]NTS76679.1 MotA/TolQ/ExbB proton channel family protein [Marinifaba aquimaris]
MEILAKYLFLLNNLVIWAILAVAFFCYAKLLDLCLFSGRNQQWSQRCIYWQSALKSMLSSLPLLGLLGTISGLLSTFFQMSVNNGFDMQEVISGGIAEAMFTTQLGLVLTVPGLLLLTWLTSAHKSWQVVAQ